MKYVKGKNDQAEIEVAQAQVSVPDFFHFLNVNTGTLMLFYGTLQNPTGRILEKYQVCRISKYLNGITGKVSCRSDIPGKYFLPY